MLAKTADDEFEIDEERRVSSKSVPYVTLYDTYIQ